MINRFLAWIHAWNAHDLDAVMEFFHDEVTFENWTGAKVSGKKALRTAWAGWFNNHGDFRFWSEDVFADEENQKLLFQWKLEWPSSEKAEAGKPEIRRGVDVIHFHEDRILKKSSYSKTDLLIDSRRYLLHL